MYCTRIWIYILRKRGNLKCELTFAQLSFKFPLSISLFSLILATYIFLLSVNTLLINPLSCHGICQERAWDTWELMSGFNKRAWLVVNSAANPDKRWDWRDLHVCVVTVTGNSRGGPVSLAIAIFSKRASERWKYSPEKPNVKCDIFIFPFPCSVSLFYCLSFMGRNKRGKQGARCFGYPGNWIWIKWHRMRKCGY